MVVCGFRHDYLYLSFVDRPPPHLLLGSCSGGGGGGGFVLWRVFFGGVGVGVVLSWSVACVLLL